MLLPPLELPSCWDARLLGAHTRAVPQIAFDHSPVGARRVGVLSAGVDLAAGRAHIDGVTTARTASERLLRRLRHLADVRAVGEHPSELVAGVDVELCEHLAEVVGDSVLADDQPRADLGVGEAIAC